MKNGASWWRKIFIAKLILASSTFNKGQGAPWVAWSQFKRNVLSEETLLLGKMALVNSKTLSCIIFLRTSTLPDSAPLILTCVRPPSIACGVFHRREQNLQSHKHRLWPRQNWDYRKRHPRKEVSGRGSWWVLIDERGSCRTEVFMYDKILCWPAAKLKKVHAILVSSSRSSKWCILHFQVMLSTNRIKCLLFVVFGESFEETDPPCLLSTVAFLKRNWNLDLRRRGLSQHSQSTHSGYYA